MVDEPKNPHAVALGKKGGKKTAEKGPEYYTEIQAQRKVRAGGRPKGPPSAPHEGLLRIADKEIYCAVLEDGTRLLSQGTFLKAIGRSRTPKAGTGGLSTVDQLPFFLRAEALKPHITEELRVSTKPIVFRMKSGQQTVGYRAELLPEVCEVYLNFRDARRRSGQDVPQQYRHIVEACDLLSRGLARVGIVALVDEATGFQDYRSRQALAELLDQFIASELGKWAKRFPDDFYKEMFRLRDWSYYPLKPKKPLLVGKLTTDLVYDRLAPGVRQELERLNPKDSRGRRKRRHHQWLTEDVGHPKLQEHLASVITLMKASDNWEEFKKMLKRALPKYPEMPLFDAVNNGEAGSADQ